MPRNRKLNPGIGARCTILTRFIHPRQKNVEEGHRTTCILTETKKLTVNKKEQVCFSFLLNGVEHYAVKRYFSVIKEGEESAFFFPEEAAKAKVEDDKKNFQEPKKKWRHSKAKKILYELLRDGTIPIEKYDVNEAEIMAIEDIFALSDQFLLYDPNKFEERLQSLRDHVRYLDDRAENDRKAFEVYKKLHKAASHTPHGYIQWQGSGAQELIWDDIHDGKLESMTPQELWESREEYRLEFPLNVFRQKVEQERRTAKYLHTVKVRGVEHKSS
jgi:hypothetical protein